MEKENLLRKFDQLVAAVENKAKGKKHLQEYVDRLRDSRGELIYALQTGDEEQASEIMELAIAFATEVKNMKEEKKGVAAVFDKLLPKPAPKKKEEPKKEEKPKPVEKAKPGKPIEPSPAGEKEGALFEANGQLARYEAEVKSLEAELAEREVELEGLKGAYAKLSSEMGEMRRKMEAKEARDVKDLAAQINEIKTGIGALHDTMNREFMSSKVAYEGFGTELLHLAVKTAEMEELIDRGDTVTEVDVLELNRGVALLEKRLAILEAEEKKKRLEFIEGIERKQAAMEKELDKKADSEKMVKTMKQHVSEIREEIDERESKIAAEMHVELKSSYYTLSEKLKKLDEALEKAKKKKDIDEIRKQVKSLHKHIQKVKKTENELERELEQQHLSDDALHQKIDSLSQRIKKSGEMDQEVIGDVYKTIEALELELKSRPGTKEIKSMAGSLNYMKGKLSKMEEHLLVCDICGKKCKSARGLVLHKKMAHRKKAKKKPKKKKKKILGIIGG